MIARILATLSILVLSLTSSAQVINSFPFSDNLETWSACFDTCGTICPLSNGWSNQGNIDFLVDNGGTATPFTGPTVNGGADHNPGNSNGQYIYTESSGGNCSSDTAIAESPFVDLNGVINPSFSFWYHQHGLSILDSFKVEYSLDSGQTWSFLADGDSLGNASNDQWMFKYINLSSLVGNIIKIRIIYITTSPFNDFALDDFHFNGVQFTDVGIDSIYSATGFCTGDTQDVCIEIENYGLLDIDSVEVTVNINGSPFNSPFMYYGPLLPGEDTIICLGQIVMSTGDVIEAYTNSPNGGNDDVPSNDTSIFNVTIFSLPLVDAGPDSTLCPLDSIVLGGNPSGPAGATYTWTPSSNLFTSSQANPTGYFNASGTYSYELFVVDTNGCEGEDSVTYTVTSISTVNAGPDTTVCTNDSFTIGGSPSVPAGFSALWSPFQFLNDDTLLNPTASVLTTTSFLLEGIDTVGCSFFDTVTVTTFPSPNLDPGLAQSICLGDSVQLGGNPTATNFQSVSWTPAGTIVNPSIANPIAIPLDTTVYMLSIVDTFGCDYQDSTQVITLNAPQINAGADTTVCAFDTFTVGGNPTGPASAVFEWSPGVLFNDSTAANPSLAITQNTTVYLKVTDTIAGCVSFDTLNISIYAIPLADAGLFDTICFGDSLVIGGSPAGPIGASYNWQPASVLNNNTLANPTFGGTSTEQLILEVTDSTHGCTNLDTTIVFVNSLPDVSSGGDQQICFGDTAQIGGSPTSTTATTFSWTPTTGLVNPNVSNPFGSPTTSTFYTIVVTDTNGCQATDSMFFQVDTIPVISVSMDTSICAGDSIELLATGGDNYSWSFPQFLNDPLLPNPKAAPLSNTTFTVTVGDQNGCSDTGSVNITVFQLPIVEAGQDQSLCDGDTITFNATGATNYQWFPTTSLTSTNTATTQSYTTSTITYYVEGTDLNGCSMIDSVSVLVNFLPPVEAGPDVFICLNDSVTIGGSPTGHTSATFEWSNPGDFNDFTLANPKYYATNVGLDKYYVTITDTSGCTAIDSTEITVYDLPTANTDPAGPPICVGDSVTLQASGGSSYSWTSANIINDGTASPTVFPPSTFTYQVIVTDGNGCTDNDFVQVDVYAPVPANAGVDTGMCQQSSIFLNASGGVSYNWSPSFGLSSTDTASPECTLLNPRTYTVTVTDVNGCTATDQVSVDVYALPTVSAGFDKQICLGEEIRIGGNPTGPSNGDFRWTPATGLSADSIRNPFASPDTTTTYEVLVTNNRGCQDSAEMTVRVDTIPVLELIQGPDSVCRGDSTTLEVTPGLSSYQWSPADFVDNPSASNPIFYPTRTRNFTLVAMDSNGCSAELTVRVEINPLPTVTLDVFPDEICEGDSAAIEAEGGVVYAWMNSDFVSDTSSARTFAKPSETGFITVAVTDTNNCTKMDSIQLVVFPLPVVDAGEDILNCEVDVVEIGGDPSSSDEVTYFWTPSDLVSDPFSPNPTVLDANNTTFYLEVQDANGCRNIDSVKVEADCYARIFAPKAFTPGGNDLNDRFIIKGYKIRDTELKIYDRYGQLVHTSNNIEEGWDGSKDGSNELMPAGVFYWRLVYRTDESRKKETEGTVTLLR